MNPVTMSPVEAHDALCINYHANISTVFYGDPGSGKTATVRDASDTLDRLFFPDAGPIARDRLGRVAGRTRNQFGLMTLNMSLYESVDLRGLPSILQGDSGLVTAWTRPDRLPQVERDGERGFLFFDECNVNRAMFPTLMQTFLERMCGEHLIPDGWICIGAGNNRTAKGVACDMPPPFNNRVSSIDYVPCWRFYVNELAARIGLHPLVVAYIKFRPEMLSLMPGAKPTATHIPAIPADARSFPTCRIWEKVSDMLKQDPKEALRARLIASLVGPEVGADFESFFVVARDATPIADIVANPDTAAIPTQIGLLHAVTSGLASYATRDNFAAIIRYGKRLAQAGQAEFYVTLGLEASRRHPEVKTSVGYTAWLSDNAALVA